MPTYDQAPAEVRGVVERMMKRFHPELDKEEVTVDLLFAFPNVSESGAVTGPALTHNGYPAAAVVRKIGLKDRVKGLADAEIVFDAEHWTDLTDQQKEALADHELTHLELVKSKKTDAVKHDDAGRPMLKLRKHDHQYGWFDCIVRRHGKHSNEAQQATNFITGPLKQLWLGYMHDSEDLHDAIFGKPIKGNRPTGKDAAVSD